MANLERVLRSGLQAQASGRLAEAAGLYARALALHPGCADAHHLSLGAAVYDPHRPMDLEHLLERAHADLHPAAAAE